MIYPCHFSFQCHLCTWRVHPGECTSGTTHPPVWVLRSVHLLSPAYWVAAWCHGRTTPPFLNKGNPHRYIVQYHNTIICRSWAQSLALSSKHFTYHYWPQHIPTAAQFLNRTYNSDTRHKAPTVWLNTLQQLSLFTAHAHLWLSELENIFWIGILLRVSSYRRPSVQQDSHPSILQVKYSTALIPSDLPSNQQNFTVVASTWNHKN